MLAIKQDHPKNTHVARLRDRCEQAALEGSWVSKDFGCNVSPSAKYTAMSQHSKAHGQPTLVLLGYATLQVHTSLHLLMQDCHVMGHMVMGKTKPIFVKDALERECTRQ